MHGAPVDLDLTAVTLDPAVARAAFPAERGGASVVLFRAFLRAHGAPERLTAEEAAERFCRMLVCPQAEPALARAVEARVGSVLGGPVALRCRYAAQITQVLQADELDELERLACGVRITFV